MLAILRSRPWAAGVLSISLCQYKLHAAANLVILPTRQKEASLSYFAPRVGASEKPSPETEKRKKLVHVLSAHDLPSPNYS